MSINLTPKLSLYIRFGARKLTLTKQVADMAHQMNVVYDLFTGTITIAGVPFLDQAIPRFKLL
ncbi:hypothetical protein BD408DRAFT_338938 [Parasitella parasitica]|nr:hypothetical protein BD408DRAFT_338938 [Parasitella parasitica]